MCWVRLVAPRVLLRACIAAAICCFLAACSAKDATNFPAPDAVEPVRNADLSARFPSAGEPSSSATGPLRALIVPGADSGFPASRDGATQTSASTVQPSGAAVVPGGVEFNFEGADIQTVAKTLLGDTLGLSFVVDPRVQGTVTFSSVGPIARKDVLPIFESLLRMSNAAVLREGGVVKIVPLPEAAGAGAVSFGAGQPGFGVSVVPLHYASATSIARMAENFLSRPGAIRADQARNILLVQGTSAERQSAIDVIASFDVEWLRNQSVGVYPLKSTTPETMIQELERIFETNESGQGQGVIQFQPVSRMNAVLAVAKSPRLLEKVTQWVQRLDRSDTSGNALRVYRLNYGNAQQVAKILNEIFVGRSGTSTETPANQLAPGGAATQSRLDSLGNGSLSAASTSTQGSSGSTGQSNTNGSSGSKTGGPIAGAFELILRSARRRRRECDGGVDQRHHATRTVSECPHHRRRRQ